MSLTRIGSEQVVVGDRTVTELAQSVGFGIYNYGPLSADPTLRPDGTVMQVGDEYHNTVTGKRRQFDGVVWNDFIGASTADLANATDPAKGAGIPAFNPLLDYPAGSIGAYLSGSAVLPVMDGETLNASTINRISGSAPITIRGAAPTGTKPSYADLIATDSAGRLALLRAYHSTMVVVNMDEPVIRGVVTFENVLVSGAGSEKIKCEGRAQFVGSSLHAIGICAVGDGYITLEAGTILSDSPGVGCHAEQGGTVEAEAAQIINAAGRGLFVQHSGVVFAAGAKVKQAGSNGAYVLYGGTIIAPGCDIDGCTGAGVLTNYGGSINISGGQVRNNNGSGVVAESNGAVYAVGAQITGNGDRGLQVVYGGVIQATNAVVTGNAALAAQALRAGYINLSGATVDLSNNAGGTQISASGIGMIETEAPGSGGKLALSSAHYSPGFNMRGNGCAYIGTAVQNDALQSVAGNSFSTRKTATIVSDAITPAGTWQIIDTEGAASNDLLANINVDPAYPVHEMYIHIANNARTVTVKHNTGNIRLATGADITLSNRNTVLRLVWNAAGSVWVQPI